jgi:hypothetical protein
MTCLVGVRPVNSTHLSENTVKDGRINFLASIGIALALTFT